MTEMNGTVTNCSYDLLNRLTQAIQRNSGGTQTASYGYGYDAVGNMTSKAINGTSTSMAFNTADQLTSAGSATFSYDLNGNQTGSSGGVSLAYNSQDQTTGMTPSGGSAIGMTYTGAGQAQRTGNGSSNYTYDGTGMGSIVTSAGTTYVTNGPNGQLISERVPGRGTYYYLFDGLGSVVGVTDSSGNVVNRYSYDPYGNTTSVTEGVSNPFRYIGAVWDSQTGLYQMGERYYDPKVGRFTQPDPLDGQTYAYAGGNPANYVDPAGLSESKPNAILNDGNEPLSFPEVNFGNVREKLGGYVKELVRRLEAHPDRPPARGFERINRNWHNRRTGETISRDRESSRHGSAHYDYQLRKGIHGVRKIRYHPGNGEIRFIP